MFKEFFVILGLGLSLDESLWLGSPNMLAHEEGGKVVKFVLYKQADGKIKE